MVVHPVLIIVGGLPATGKSAVAGTLALELGLAFVRIDGIEQAIIRSSCLRQPLGAVGYVVGYAIAAEQLRHGVSVVAECVNPLAVTRDAWRAVGQERGAQVLEVELVCSDEAEHRRRAESRRTDIPGLVLPTWQQILDREYETWTRDHLVIDTATHTVADSVTVIRQALDLDR
ncbi:MAG: adenylyl-sulfate kinase [Actinophytocola sp.]|nr:adenylyl-sulfate kinase [Actinophytocola sp.]